MMIGGSEKVRVDDTEGALEVLRLIRIEDGKVVMVNSCLVVVVVSAWTGI